MTYDDLRKQLPKGCELATLEGRLVIVWKGNGPVPREVLARFGTPHEQKVAAAAMRGTR